MNRPYFVTDKKRDRLRSTEWAAEILKGRKPYVIFDLQTIDSNSLEVIELAVIDIEANLLFNSKFNPHSNTMGKDSIPHGIFEPCLSSKPTWLERFDDIENVFKCACLSYHLGLNLRAISNTSSIHQKRLNYFNGISVGEWHAQYIGNWNSYSGEYEYPLITDVGGTALEKCLNTLKVLKEMASSGL
jgi:hypothetical protein